MPINYFPNDPNTPQAPMVQVAPSADRPQGRSGFKVQGLPAEAAYPPASAGFVAWQAREAALRTVAAFERICGPLPGWTGSGSKRSLNITPDGGEEINAYYNRSALEFFHAPLKGGTMQTGASAEVVAHEAGHAILDAIRPQLWNENLMEIAAFHEGFGDCMAVMLCLDDRGIRQTLVQKAGTLGKANLVETMGEQIALAIKQAYGPNFNASGPRHALNAFQWSFPDSLPLDGKPGTLINESHSLGQLVSGVFYQLITCIYGAGAGGEGKLLAAMETAVRLAAGAAARAPIKARFIDSWGRTMLVIDTEEMGGANAACIRQAFQAHGIQLSSTAMLAPNAQLSSRKLGRAQRGMSMLPEDARTDLRSMLGVAEGEDMEAQSVRFGDRRVSQVAGLRRIDLTGLSERLEGVAAFAIQTALVGNFERGTAMLGGVESGVAYGNEVRGFVATLVHRGAIAYDEHEIGASKGAGYVVGKGAFTHAVRERRGERVLERVAFACGCGAAHSEE